MSAYELIRAKREGRELDASEIESLVNGYLEGSIADYQMSAFLMAVFFRGMTDAETEALTRAMLASGIALDLSSVGGVKVDKHSTGGVGDKLSLIVAPVAAAAGVPVPMISGRGLGHTGGTLDKLESIPGFSTEWTPDEFEGLVSDVGMAIVGQSPRMAPADRKMYALRDVTATIECPPLIVGSILSKKLAAGLDALVLDVKVGRGAFMKDMGEARSLAERLIGTADRLGLPATALITDMESPLGHAVGNALEVREAIEVLKGGGPPDVREVSLALASRMISLGEAAENDEEASRLAEEELDSGRALEVFARFVEAQCGDPRVVHEAGLLPEARVRIPVPARTGGFLRAIDALEIGLSAVSLGAGRSTIGDRLDPSVGIVLEASVGDEVAEGAVLANVHAADEGTGDAVANRVAGAFTISEETAVRRSRVLEDVRGRPR